MLEEFLDLFARSLVFAACCIGMLGLFGSVARFAG